MKVAPLPLTSFLLERLSYDPISGILLWRVAPRRMFATESARKRFNTLMAGKRAGHDHIARGKPHAVFVTFYIDGRNRGFVAHRIIYAMMGAAVPDGMEIDHKNRNPWDNKWENLRLATQSSNLCNQESKKRRSERGFGLPKGVSYERGRYKSQIQIRGKKIYIGSYGTPEEASEAYMKAGAIRHGEFFYRNQTPEAAA